MLTFASIMEEFISNWNIYSKYGIEISFRISLAVSVWYDFSYL